MKNEGKGMSEVILGFWSVNCENGGNNHAKESFKSRLDHPTP